MLLYGGLPTDLGDSINILLKLILKKYKIICLFFLNILKYNKKNNKTIFVIGCIIMI
jgi:hypothetical protein